MGIFSKFIDRAKKNAEPQSIYTMPITPENAQQRSELFHEKHMKNIEGYEKFDKKDVINRDLTPKEVSFLKYVDGKEPEAIAGYWTHEEALDIAKELRIFFAYSAAFTREEHVKTAVFTQFFASQKGSSPASFAL